MEPGFAASEIDTSRPHPARMYDAYLGGRDNYPVDREAVRQILRDFPEARLIAQANRAFLQRSVRFLAAEAGIWQFLDIGTGIPSAGNVAGADYSSVLVRRHAGIRGECRRAGLVFGCPGARSARDR
jgi:hypothetical protein